MAFSAAEPIRPDTIDRFLGKLLPGPFAECLAPGYGLAEAALSGLRRWRGPATVLVCDQEALPGGKQAGPWVGEESEP